MPPATAAQPIAPQGRSAPAVPTIDEILAYTQQTYDAARFAPRTKDDLRQLAEDFYRSGTLPDSFYAQRYKTDGNGKVIRDGDNNPIPIKYTEEQRQWHFERGVAKAVIIMRYGAMLRVLPEAAIYSIYLIDNKPSPAAALMVACALARPDICLSIQTLTSTAAKCVIRVHRRGHEPEDIEATAAEYQHLNRRTVWIQYPADMLYARCASRAMRRKFPDLFSGVYCMEERADLVAERAMAERPQPAGHIEAILQMADMPSPAEENHAERGTERPTVAVPVQIEPSTPAVPQELTDKELKIVNDAQAITVGDPITKPLDRPRWLAVIKQAALPPERIEAMLAEAERRWEAARKAAGGGA